MTRRTPITLLGAAAVPLVALAVVGCGGGGSSATAKASASKTTSTPQSSSTVASPPKAPTARGTTLRTATTGLGKLLVDSHGRTLYLFKGDKGMTSTCTGACVTAWPPLRTSGKPTVGGGVKASLLGTTKRAGGQTQVTYNGHPLYTFVMDQKPGDTKGEGVNAFGASCFALSPAGNAITPKSTAPKPAPAKPAAPPAAKKPAPPSNGIPQNNGGDGDSDNNGGPSDGDGGI
jgi:predicted lipoprotein with Yx(FWY)xxD motif